MKSKLSTFLLAVLFTLVATFTSKGQNDCYDIQCPSKIFAPCEGVYGGHVWFSVTTSNRCNPALTPSVHYSIPPGSVFPPGTNVVCATIQVPGLPPRECCFQVIVDTCCSSNCLDVICPPDIVVPCQDTSSGPGAMVVLPKPVATNHCGDQVLPANLQWRSFPGVQPGQPTFFGPGTHTITYCLTDGQGFMKCCSFNVVVTNCPPVQNQCAPRLECPKEIQVQCEGPNGGIVFFPPPQIADPCGLIIATNSTHQSGQFFPNGKTTVAFCITWVHPATGQQRTECCSFDVVVRCCPTNCVSTLNCPTNVVVECPGPNGVKLDYSVTTTGDCGQTTIVCDPPPGSVIFGPTNVCCRLLSPTGALLDRCCFPVVVKDNVPPTINCPSNIVVVSQSCQPIDVAYHLPVALDNCQLDGIICTPPPGSPFPVGVTAVTCCAWDKAGNTNCCSFTVTVRCPTNDCVRMVCPTNILVECAGPNGTPVTYNAYATNFCTGGVLPVTCSVPSGANFPPGLTTVCCTNINNGIVERCCFEVRVRPDTIPPVIKCPTNMFILCARPNGAKVPFSVTASDNCDPTPTITCVPPSGSHFSIGCSNVTCVAVDDAGNTSTCSFKVCLLPQGCYLRNPSFELLGANLPPAANCGDPINFAGGWTALAGTPDLFRPPWASVAPGNCRGQEKPCHGTNYAGLEGGYTASGGFATEAMMGTLIAPLSNGQKFRLRACLSLAESSIEPVLVEFVLANSGNLAQQHVIHQVWVTKKNGWMQYLPPCFTVPQNGNWDRLMIRMAQIGTTSQPYKTGYVYVDNVNICCCKPILHTPVLDRNTVVLTWDGPGRLQATGALSEPTEWHAVEAPVEMDPETGLYSTRVPRSPEHRYFQVVGSDETIDCDECSSGE